MLLFLPTQCFAQFGVSGKFNGGTFLPAKRLDARGIQKAKELIALGEFSQSIRFLDNVLARTEDSFVAASDGEHYGLKETARHVLRDLPPEGRRIYETTFGPVARRLLKQTLESGDDKQLREITQRYFYTPAGHEAALLFAQHESDQGRHLTAALTYQQLLETPEAATRFEPQLSILAATSWLAVNNRVQAEAVLESFQEQGYRNIHLSGQDSPIYGSRHGLVDWLLQSVGTPVIKNLATERQWLTTRGNAARNGQAEGGLPHLRMRWQARLLEHHDIEAVHEEMASLLKRQEEHRLPAAIPLAAGDYVITRSAHGLVAIDFTTGKKIWRSQPQRTSLLQQLVDRSDDNNERRNNVEPAQSYARLVWQDYLYNTISSDGERVFVIRDLTTPALDRRRALQLIQQQQTFDQDADINRLCAYDLPTEGKLVWEIDGASRSDELKGAFFLGAPLAVGQSLYCLMEIKSETAIYLVALDRQTGALQWRQQLADLEHGISRDLKRRLQASMPSYDEGMLICPTGAGVVVGVDLAKHALAWAYRYPVKKMLTPRQRIMEDPTGTSKQQWIHSAPVIAEGRVLLTPPESNDLHCIDIITGKLLWKRPRGDAMFLAGVEDGVALLVENQQLSAVLLDDGKPAWSSKDSQLPDGSSPAGSGFFSKGRYFLPLSNSQVIAIHVADGKQVAQARSRDGQSLGNLICHRGAVISQTGRFLDCFEQVDVLRKKSEHRLAKNANDSEALRTLGEIAYNDGNLAQAVELLSKAYESEPEDLRTREVLAEALVAGLDEEFAEYQNLLPLLTELQLGSTEAQITLMRLQAQGLQELGRANEAFDVCLQAFDLLLDTEIELAVGQEHKVDARRWLAAQSASAWASADANQREVIGEQFAPLLSEVELAQDSERWQHFYDCFGSLELSAPVGIKLAREYLMQDKLLLAQQMLLRLSKSNDPIVHRATVALNSHLLHEANMPYLAVTFDRALQKELADEICLDGKTGAECLAEWSTTDKMGAGPWPYGQVEITSEESKPVRSRTGSGSPTTGIYLERSDDVLGSCNVSLVRMSSGRNQAIAIRDSQGQDFYQAKLEQSGRSVISHPQGIYAVSNGNLLVVSLGQEIMAFDTLSTSQQPLWRKNTTSSLQYLNSRRAIRGNKLGGRPSSRVQINGNWLGVLGPVTHDSCLFQIEQRLVCVDAYSGNIKWSRDNLPLGCDLYGDEKYVFVVPKESKHALIFSTVDGRSLGETTDGIPAWHERLATVGRNVIRWRKRPDRRWELSAFDSLEGKILWNFEFEKNARLDITQNRFIAVVEPSGHCRVIDARSGRSIVDQPIDPSVSLQEVHLLAGTNSFTLAVQRPPQVDLKKRRVLGFNNVDFTKQPFAGEVYLFDRKSGSSLWDGPAKIEGLPLMLSQAVDLPMIAFAGNIRRRDKQGAKTEVGMLLLEKSSGRLLFHDEHLPSSAHHCYLRVSDSKPNEAVVELLNRKISLKFTGSPRAPEPPARQDARRDVGTKARGLQKIGESLIRGL